MIGKKVEPIKETGDEVEQLTSPLIELEINRKGLIERNILSYLTECFAESKNCDVSVHVNDQEIQAHKIVLSASSRVWREMFDNDESLAVVTITDFDCVTIKDLIGYMYTGVIKEGNDKLFIAAIKYDVNDLKLLCEEKLKTTINIENVVNLLILAYLHKADDLFTNLIVFVRENFSAFKDLEETKSIFMTYPGLGYEIFTRIM